MKKHNEPTTCKHWPCKTFNKYNACSYYCQSYENKEKIMDFRYGEFEMVNGAVCNRLKDDNERLKDKIAKVVREYSDSLWLIAEFDQLLNDAKDVLQDLNTRHFKDYGCDIPAACDIVGKIKEITKKERK